MLARSSAEIIDCAMDGSLEVEEDTDGIEWNGDIDDEEGAEEVDNDVDIICVDEKVPDVFNFETDLQDVVSIIFWKMYVHSFFHSLSF